MPPAALLAMTYAPAVLSQVDQAAAAPWSRRGKFCSGILLKTGHHGRLAWGPAVPGGMVAYQGGIEATWRSVGGHEVSVTILECVSSAPRPPHAPAPPQLTRACPSPLRPGVLPAAAGGTRVWHPLRHVTKHVFEKRNGRPRESFVFTLSDGKECPWHHPLPVPLPHTRGLQREGV
ncbi:hypothetical protein E2C01_026967 [Portunus trituberculatus]|uniref:Uncharacterized protein n=1 Tax=Portunus trituberculatus TaxID=210409 RepID=A0A5B7EHI3_PORTR|nr:hypothetical protein [Portunus trituberculatus]